ncbi:MAG: LPXTG cell wall anchor domain-containing protein [Clostridia bacterium]|nr:LPXTG cell wall anchor domain-containing protein [Clostridia bacterium]
MRNLKLKIIFLVGIFSLILLLGLPVNAANENVQLVKQTETDYLIYINGNLDSSFEFAFSDDNTADKETLTYLSAATDSAEGGNYIAYINSYTTENKYMWAKDAEGTYFVEGIELDLSKAIPADELTAIQNVTKKIAVDTEKVQVEEKTIDGNQVTVTTGKVVFENEGNYEYQIVKLPSTTEYNELMDLAERISKINSTTDMYTKLGLYTKFNNLYNELSLELLDEKWIDVQNQEILQPEDTENGDKYVLWIREGNTTDAQFLTSKYVEEKVTEEITVKLPVTGDNNTLLIVLGILVVAIIVVSIRIKSLKKENK